MKLYMFVSLFCCSLINCSEVNQTAKEEPWYDVGGEFLYNWSSGPMNWGRAEEVRSQPDLTFTMY